MTHYFCELFPVRQLQFRMCCLVVRSRFMKAAKLFTLLIWITVPALAWSNVDGAKQLERYYQQMQLEPSEPVFKLPFNIYSSEIDNRLSADVYSVIKRPFDNVASALTDSTSWCEFMPLNLNVKSCTSKQQDGQTLLTFYAGRKYYEEPEAAYQLNYFYQVATLDSDYMKVILDADQGPFGTRDYLIVVEAMPVDNNTFVRIHSSYQTSLRSRLGTQAYLATLGQAKVGFSVESNTTANKPVFIKGIRGIIERNVMRYYLALKAFLDTTHLSYDERFEARINTWFDLSENFATQLHELGRDEYLQAKRQEWNNQLRLQQSLLRP